MHAVVGLLERITKIIDGEPASTDGIDNIAVMIHAHHNDILISYTSIGTHQDINKILIQMREWERTRGKA